MSNTQHGIDLGRARAQNALSVCVKTQKLIFAHRRAECALKSCARARMQLSQLLQIEVLNVCTRRHAMYDKTCARTRVCVVLCCVHSSFYDLIHMRIARDASTSSPRVCKFVWRDPQSAHHSREKHTCKMLMCVRSFMIYHVETVRLPLQHKHRQTEQTQDTRHKYTKKNKTHPHIATRRYTHKCHD